MIFVGWSLRLSPFRCACLAWRTGGAGGGPPGGAPPPPPREPGGGAGVGFVG